MWMPPVPKPKRERRRHFLKEWRVYRGYKQELAAEMAGMTRENLSKIERGLVPYTQDTLETLAEAYMCEPQDLIMRDPTRPDAPWSIYDQLQRAPAPARRQIEAIVEAILKNGTDG